MKNDDLVKILDAAYYLQVTLRSLPLELFTKLSRTREQELGLS